MNYKDTLSPWVIYRCLPNLQQIPVARFRRRNDAEEHLKIIQRLLPQASFAIAFDINPPHLSKGSEVEKVADNPSIHEKVRSHRAVKRSHQPQP